MAASPDALPAPAAHVCSFGSAGPRRPPVAKLPRCEWPAKLPSSSANGGTGRQSRPAFDRREIPVAIRQNTHPAIPGVSSQRRGEMTGRVCSSPVGIATPRQRPSRPSFERRDLTHDFLTRGRPEREQLAAPPAACKEVHPIARRARTEMTALRSPSLQERRLLRLREAKLTAYAGGKGAVESVSHE
jgi:hypothetical protein